MLTHHTTNRPSVLYVRWCCAVRHAQHPPYLRPPTWARPGRNQPQKRLFPQQMINNLWSEKSSIYCVLLLLMAMAVGWWLVLVAAAAYGAMVAEKHSTPCDGIPVAPHTNRNGERINERNSHTGCGRSLWKRRPSTKVNGRGLVGWLLACLQNPLENTLTKHIYYVSDFFSIFLFYFVSFWVAFFLSCSLCLWCFRCFHSHDKRHWSILDNNSNQIDSMIFEKFRRNRRDWIDTNGVQRCVDSVAKENCWPAQDGDDICARAHGVTW